MSTAKEKFEKIRKLAQDVVDVARGRYADNPSDHTHSTYRTAVFEAILANKILTVIHND